MRSDSGGGKIPGDQDNLISCTQHIDENFDMLCDVCLINLPFSDYVENKSIEAVNADNSVVRVDGKMPKDTYLESKEVSNADATVLAQKFIEDISSGDILLAYDISMVSDSMEYQPGDFSQVVKVNISNLDLDINDSVAFLHIIDENNYEIIPLSKISNNELEFRATRFSTYILIYVDTFEVSFNGSNFKVYDVSGDLIPNGATVVDGTNFNFTVVPDEGYGISSITLVDATTNPSGDNYLSTVGSPLGMVCKINKVSQNLQIDVTTALAPTITAQPVSTKVSLDTKATFTASATNATTFAWQYRENADDSWKDVTSDIGSATINGNTSTLTTVYTLLSMSGYEFRCLVGNDTFTNDETVKTDIAILSVTPGEIFISEPPIITSQPSSTKVEALVEQGVFEVTAVGEDLTFAWQYRETDDDFWKDVTDLIGNSNETPIDEYSMKSTFTTVIPNYEMAGFEFRCLVGNKSYTGDNAIKSDIAVLSLTNGGDSLDVEYFLLNILEDPKSQKVKLGEEATFTIKTEGATAFKWQYRPNEDSYWYDVDSTLGRGYDTDTLVIDTSIMKLSGDGANLEIVNNISGYEFRCLVINGAIPTYEKPSKIAFLIVAQDIVETLVQYDEPEVNLVATSGDAVDSISLAWDMQSGIKYRLYSVNSNGSYTLIEDNVTTPYTDTGLVHNTSYEYVIEGYDENDASYIARDSIIARTAYDDIYDRINKDTVKPVISNEKITPSTGKISPNSEIKLTFNVTDENYDALNGSLLYPEDIKVLIDGMEATTANIDRTKASIPSGERFTVTIKNIWGNGNISIKIPADKIFDLATNGNAEKIINTDLEAVRSLVSPVTNLRATSGDSENSITVTWEDNVNTGSLKYVLEVSNGDNNWISLKEGQDLSYTHQGLSKNMSFEYRVKVVTDSGDESDYVYTIGRTMHDPIYDDVMIDKVKPVITLEAVSPDVDYIGSTQELTLTFESFDENYNKDMTKINPDSFIIKIDSQILTDVTKSLKVSDITSGEKFELTLGNITGTGNVKVYISGDMIIDSALNGNDPTEIDTGVDAMNGDTITDAAPTLTPGVHTISVACNQVSTIKRKEVVYQYRRKDEGAFQIWETTEELSSLITGLSSDTEYEVRTVVTDIADNTQTSQSAFVRTLKIDASAIVIDHETKEWTNTQSPNPEVNATITWNDTEYTHQYSFDNTNWNTVTGTTTTLNITENVTIYARYSDGIGHSDPVTYEIGNIDKIRPKIETVTVPEGIANTKTITVSGIRDEGGSGLKGYYINIEANLNDATWTAFTGDSFEFVATENDIYYIWVIDNAGNISEAKTADVSGLVDKVKNPVLEDLEIDVFETAKIPLTFEGTAKSITYTLGNTSLATLDAENKEVTGAASGETTLTVVIENYDETKETLTANLKVNAIDPGIGTIDDTDITLEYGNNSVISIDNINEVELTISSDDSKVAVGTFINEEDVQINSTGVGTTFIRVKSIETPQYISKEIAIKVTVTPKELEFTWSKDEFDYDGRLKTITAEITNLVDDDEVVITYSGNQETDAGNYTAEIIGIDNPNYKIPSNNKKDWVINRVNRNLVVAPTSLTITYGVPKEVTYSYSGDDQTAVIDAGDGSIVTTTLADAINSGVLTVEAVSAGSQAITITIPESRNYNADSKTINVVTSLATGEIVIADRDVKLTYGDEPYEITYGYAGNGIVEASSSNNTIVSVSVDEEDKIITVTPLKASEETVTITVTSAKTEQFDADTETIAVKVNKLPVILEWSDKEFVYDGNKQIVTAIVKNKVGEDKVEVTNYSNNEQTTAGIYTATATALDNSNYTLENGTNISHTWEIKKAPINVTIEMADYVFGGILPEPEIKGNSGDGDVTYYYYESTETKDDAKDFANIKTSVDLEAGTYNIFAIVKETTNYEGAESNIDTFEVTKADIEVELLENGESYDNNWTNNNIEVKVIVPSEVTTLSNIYYRYESDGVLRTDKVATIENNVATLTFDEDINEKVSFVAVDIKGKSLTTESTAYVIKIDKQKPVIGNVEAPSGKANRKTITVSNIADAGESGIYGYFVNTVDSVASATWTEFTGNTFTYVVEENRDYFIYVIDNAGNISNVSEIRIENIVKNISNIKFEEPLELKVFETKKPIITYSGEPASTKYEIVDTNIATVDEETGEVTGISYGSTVLKVTYTDYDGTVTPIEIDVNVARADFDFALSKEEIELTYGVQDYITYLHVDDTIELEIKSNDTDVVTYTFDNANNRIYLNPVNVGKTTVEVNAPATAEYEGANKTITVTVVPRVIEVTWSQDDPYTYDENEKQVTAQITNIVGNDTVEIIYSGDKATNAGTYKTEITGVTNTNYTISGASNLSKTWVINKANRTLEITPTSQNLTYGEDGTITFTYEGDDVTARVESKNTNIATIKNYTDDNKAGTITVEPKAAGTAKIHVIIDATLNYNSISGDAEVIVAKSTAGGLTFVNPPTEITYGDNPIEVEFDYNGNGQVSAETGSGDIISASVSGDKVIIRPEGAGETTVTIKATETEQFEAEEVTITIKVNPRKVTLAWDYTSPFTYDGEYKKVLAEVTDEITGDTVNVKDYEFNNMKDAGTYTAKALSLDNPNYTLDGATNNSCTWVINKANREITMPESINIAFGTEEILHFTYTGDDVTAEISLNTPNFINIKSYVDGPNSGDVTLETIAGGTTILTVTVPGTNNYNQATKSCEVKISAADGGLVVKNDNITFTYGDDPFTTEFEYGGDGEVTVISGDTSVAIAKKNGNQIIITPVNAGTTTIKVSAAETEQFAAAEKEIKVTVNQRPVKLEWSKKEFTYDGTSKTVTATIKNIVTGDTVTVTDYNNDSTGTMAKEYVAEALALSNTNYTLTNGENVTHNWKIKKADRELEVIPKNLTLTYGENGTITYIYSGDLALNSNILVKSEATNIVTVQNVIEGKTGTITVTPKAAGKTKVVITIKEDNNYNVASKECIVTINKNTAEKVTVDEANKNLEFTYGDASKTINYYYEGNGEVTATSSNEDSVIVSVNSGDKTLTITPKNAGNAVITVNAAETNQYGPSSIEINVSVKQKAVKLEWSDDSFVYDGEAKTVTAIVKNPVNGETVNVIDYSGETETNVGSYTATATLLDDSNYTLVGGENITHNWTITKTAASINLTMEDYIYGGDLKVPHIEGNTEGGTEKFYVYSGDVEANAIDWALVKDSMFLAPGTYKMYGTVGATDNFEETKTNTVEFEVIILDITVEVTENGIAYDESWTNNDVIATVTIPSGVTKMSSLYYRIDGEVGLRTYDTTLIENGKVTITFDKDFNHKIYFVGVNTNGRAVTTETRAYEIKVDKTKPTIGSVSAPSEKANTKLITVSNIKDTNGSGIAGYYIGVVAGTDGVTFTPFSGESFTYEVSENDEYFVYVKDNAGNISDAASIEVSNIVDKISNATMPDIEVKVFESIHPKLTYSGEKKEITYLVYDESIATINAITGTITGVASGETTVTAILRNYDNTTVEVTAKLTVIPADPTLEVYPEELNFIYGASSSSVTYNYNNGGSGELTVSSGDEDVVSIEVRGNEIIVTPRSAGETTITLNFANSLKYKEISREIKVKVNPRPIQLNWPVVDYTYDGNEKSVTAEITNLVSGDSVNLIYKDNEKTDADTYTAVVTGVDNSNYTVIGGLNTSYIWKIKKANRKVDIREELILNYGVDGELTFTYDGDDVTASPASSLVDVAKVSNYVDETNKGTVTVTPVGAGTCNIIVTIPGTKNYNEATPSCKVTVSAIEAEIEIESGDITLTYGDLPVTSKFTYTGNSDNINVSVSDDTVITAKVTGSNVVITPKGAGRATLTLEAAATEQYNETSTTITVIVNPRPVKLKWSDNEFIYNGGPHEVTATIENLVDGDVTNITYSGNREVNAKKYVAEVIALTNKNYTLTGGENVKHNWEILKANRNLENIKDIEITYGETKEVIINYTGDDVDAKPQIINENVAIIDYEDLDKSVKITIEPVGEGETTVTVDVPESDNHNGASGSFKVKVLVADPKLEVLPSDVTLTYGDGSEVVTFNRSGDGKVTVISLKETVATATVNENQIIIKPINAGSAELRVITEKTSQYEEDTETIYVTVKPRPVELDWGTTIFAYDGLPKVVEATVKNKVPGDTVTVTSYEGNNRTNIGNYTAIATGLSNDNYTLTDGINVSVNWVIRELLPPSIVVTQGTTIIPSGSWASGDVIITIEPLDELSVEATYEYSYNGDDWFEYTMPFAYTEETNDTTIYVRTYNKQSGVRLSLEGEYELRLDKTDPDVKIESVNAEGSINGSINKNSVITVELNLEDYISGVEAGEFTADDIKVIVLYKGETKELIGINKVLTPAATNDSKENGVYDFTLTLSGIEENGRLSIRIDEKAIYDRAKRFNKGKTLNLGLLADNEGPDVGLIETSADEYGRLYGNSLDLKVSATDDSGIASYEWQVSRDGKTWNTFEKDETSAEKSEVIYNATEEGMHHFRVIVTDILGNYSISQTSTVNINITMNRKPTIRFETEQVSATRVKIIAIIKSTKALESIKVNSSEINKTYWDIVKTNNEITVTTEYTTTANGTYIWEVIDEAGNKAVEEFNVTTIDDEAAVITYVTYDATEYAKAKIEFTGSKDMRISKVIKPDGTTTNIITGKEIAGMEFDKVDFSRKVTVRFDGIEFEKGTTFVFESKAFVETYVPIEKEIQTKIIYIRATSTGTKLFDELFGAPIDIPKAEMLVGQMAAKTKKINEKITSYYGLTGTPIIIKLTEGDELRAVGYLVAAESTNDILRMNEYTDPQGLTAQIIADTGGSNALYTNGNITGLKTYGGNILHWGTAETPDNTFRITIREN